MLRRTARRPLYALLTLALLAFSLPAFAEGLAPTDGLADFSKLQGFRVCEGKPERPTANIPWNKKRNFVLTKAANPRHAAEDALTTPGTKIELKAKFTYGRASKDLNEEDVFVARHDCKGWKAVGNAKTDDDGWLSLTIEAPKKPGVYALAFTVAGDRSQVFSRLWVLPKGQRLVVLDIDGTLTTDDDQIKNEVLEDHFNKLGAGKHDPKKYPFAVELTHALAKRGDILVYLSGRPYWLVPHSRHWLDQHGFAPGAVIHTRTHREVVPEVVGVGEYKRDNMLLLKSRGLNVAEGYGNASTDVWAYDAAGIAGTSTWIIGPVTEKGKAHDVKDSWEGRVRGMQLRPAPKSFNPRKDSGKAAPKDFEPKKFTP